MSFATLVRIVIVLEVLAWSAVAGWLAAAWNLAIGWGLLVAIGASAGARAMIVIASNALASLRQPHRKRIGIGGWLVMMAGEWRAIIVDNFWRLPFENVVFHDADAAAKIPGEPIILVHGYFCNRGMLEPIYRALIAANVGPVFSFSYPPISRGIREVVPLLSRAIDDAIAKTGAQRVRLVCHSMGGLVARSAWVSAEHARVSAIVTLATPHQGTVLAYLGLGRNARHMQPASAFYAALQRDEMAAGQAPITSIYTTHDNLVSPYTSSELVGARWIQVDGVNHIALLNDPRVITAVVAALK